MEQNYEPRNKDWGMLTVNLWQKKVKSSEGRRIVSSTNVQLGTNVKHGNMEKNVIEIVSYTFVWVLCWFGVYTYSMKTYIIGLIKFPIWFHGVWLDFWYHLNGELMVHLLQLGDLKG